MLLRPSESISGVWFKEKKTTRWGFDPANMFFSFESKSQSEGGLFSVMFFPSTYQSKRVRHVKCVFFFSGYDSWSQMMLAGSRWSRTVLTVGAGLELRDGVFPQEEEQTALGGEKTRDTYQQFEMIFIQKLFKYYN